MCSVCMTMYTSVYVHVFLCMNTCMFVHMYLVNKKKGAGVPSLVAGSVASSVTLTDMKSILSMCHKSVDLNRDLVRNGLVKKMDWSKEIRSFDQYYDIILGGSS